MAIFYLETKPIKRSEGRSSVASSAYRAGVVLVDERTGLRHDYTPKGKNGGVVSKDCFVWIDGKKTQIDREKLWNAAEFAEKRKDGRTGRDFIANLPFELSAEQREKIVKDFTKLLSERYGVAVDYAIHLPDKKGDNRNHHVHVLTTTRKATIENGNIVLGEKTMLEQENGKLKKLGLPLTQEQITDLRTEWQNVINHHLELAGLEIRIDSRSYEEQGKKQIPTIKLGARASEDERNGIATRKGDYNRLVKKANAEKWSGTMEQYIEKTIRDLELEIVFEQRKQNNKQSPQFSTIERQKPSPIGSTTMTAKEHSEPTKGQNEPLSFKEKMQKQVAEKQEKDKVSEPTAPALSFKERLALDIAIKEQQQQERQQADEQAERERAIAERNAELAKQNEQATQEKQAEPQSSPQGRTNKPRPF